MVCKDAWKGTVQVDIFIHGGKKQNYLPLREHLSPTDLKRFYKGGSIIIPIFWGLDTPRYRSWAARVPSQHTFHDTLCRKWLADHETSGPANHGFPLHCCHLSLARLKEPADPAKMCAQGLSALQGFSIWMSVQASQGTFFYQENK